VDSYFDRVAILSLETRRQNYTSTLRFLGNLWVRGVSHCVDYGELVV
jgi:hypothetical protein